MKLKAATRLVAALDEDWIATIKAELKANGNTESDFTDDDKNTLIVYSDMMDVIEVLDAVRWTVKEERDLKGGLFTNGSVVIMVGGQFPIKLMQIAPRRIYLCKSN
jgi:hypothetical protein